MSSHLAASGAGPASSSPPERHRGDSATPSRPLPYLWRYRWRVGVALTSLVGAKAAEGTARSISLGAEAKRHLIRFRIVLAPNAVQLSIDDFGTGYSSLACLKGFPIDKLKIDRSFVLGLPVLARDAGIVRAIPRMAGAPGIKVIAGVARPRTFAGRASRLNCSECCLPVGAHLFEAQFW